MLVAAVWAARYWEKTYQEDESFRQGGGPKRLLSIACSLAVLELHADTRLDSNGRKYIQQRLQATDQLLGVVHECNTFAYFVQKGAVVEPRFLKKGSREEIIVRWNGYEIPVQCKCKQPGAGRAISQDAFTTLAGCIARDVKLSGQKLIVRIRSTGPIRPQDIGFLRNQVQSRAGSGFGPALVTNGERTFTVKAESLKGSFTVEQARDYLKSYGFHLTFGIGEPRADGNGYEADVVVGIDANPEEKPWNSLNRSVNIGAKQLEGGPPGIVAVHYADPVDDFESLRLGTSPMKIILGQKVDLLPHVGAVLISSEPDLQLPGAGGPGHMHIYHGKEWRFPTDFPLGEPV